MKRILNASLAALAAILLVSPAWAGITISGQVPSQKLTDIAALAVTDSNVIVGDGTTWVAESGATARTSLGLGTAATPQFTRLGLGAAAHAAYLILGEFGTAGTATGIETAHTDNTNGGSNSSLSARVGGGSGGDPVVSMGISGVGHWQWGIDNSDSDKLKLDWDTSGSAPTAVGNGTTVATILTNGALLINGTAAYGLLTPNLETNASAGRGGVALNGWANSDSEMVLDFQKAKSGAVGSHTSGIVAVGETLGNTRGLGSDGTAFRVAGQIKLVVDSTPGASDMPGRWEFHVTPDGSATPAEALRITSTKQITTLAATPSNITAAGSAIFGGGIAFTDVANAWIDDATHGDGTTTLYIGNNTVNTSAPSDAHLKRNIRPTKIQALPLINGIEMDDYFWRDPKMGVGEQFGWVAQQVHGVIPEVVDTPADSPWRVQGHKLMPYAIKAIQELTARNAALEARLAALEGKPAGLNFLPTMDPVRNPMSVRLQGSKLTPAAVVTPKPKATPKPKPKARKAG